MTDCRTLASSLVRAGGQTKIAHPLGAPRAENKRQRAMAKPPRKRKRPVQLDLAFEARAKARKRAGRKPGKGRGFVRHRPRELHASSHPLHVVMRSKFRPLRSQFVFPTLRNAL